MRLQPFQVKGPSKGYIKNLSPEVIDDTALVLVGGTNVLNRLGGVEMFPGWSKFYGTALTGTPLSLGPYRKADGSKKLVCLTEQKAYAWNTLTNVFDDITRVAGSYTAAVMQPWDTCQFKDLLIFTNGSDNIQKYTMSGVATDLAGTPPKAKVLCTFMNTLILGSLNDGTVWPDKIMWSADSNPEDWTAANGSGSARLMDTPGEILAIVPVKGHGTYVDNTAIIYKDDSWYTLSYVGSPWYFKIRPQEIRTGLMAAGAVVDVQGTHYFVGRDNIYALTGANTYQGPVATPIGDPIREEFFSSLNPAYSAETFVFADTLKRDIYFCIPTMGNTSPNRAYVYNWELQVWSPPIDFPAMCAGEWTNSLAQTIDQMTAPIDSYSLPIDSALTAAGSRIMLFGGADGYVRQLDPNLVTRDGANFAAEAEFKRISLGTTGRKRVLQVAAQGSSLPTAGLPVYVGSADTPDENLLWYAAGSILPNVNPWSYGDVSGRYVAVKFRTESSDRRWRITGYEPRFILQSER